MIIIAMSHGFTGSKSEIEYLTKLVLPIFIDIKNITKPWKEI